MDLHNTVELSAVEGAGDWLLEVRIRRAVVGYVRRNPLLGTYRYYRGYDGALVHEGNDLEGLLRWVAYRP